MNNFNSTTLEPIKISFDTPIYYVNKKTNKVGCRLQFEIKGPDSVIKVINSFADEDCFEVVAEASLHPDDNFDIEKGTTIARAKAETMAYRRVNRLFKRICGKLANVAIAFMDFDHKALTVINNNDDFLSKFD